jgi:fumarylacetoacetate (FAA) hydrolase
MKLATLKDGSRDGRLVVVSRDLTRFSPVGHIARTLQDALDDWLHAAPRLMEVAEGLESGSQPAQRFHEHDAMAPLPRAHLWADGSAYLNHVELVRRARGADLPESFRHDPLMYVGAADALIGARDPILAASEAWGIDMEGEVGVITDDVPMGVNARDALGHVKLVVILNDISFRRLIPDELAKGFGFCQSKGPTAFSPVAVTPDELGEAWNGGKLSGALLVGLNGQPFGRADAGVDMNFDFGQLIAHAAKTRPLQAGAIIGSGTVSNRDPDGSPGRTAAAGGAGFSCIAELRTAETLRDGKASTPFLRFGDIVRIEMKDGSGHTIFGAIEQMAEQAVTGA